MGRGKLEELKQDVYVVTSTTNHTIMIVNSSINNIMDI